MKYLNRINIDPVKMGGVPIVRNLRMPVATILQLLADGKTHKEILDLHPELEEDDIKACLEYASKLTKTREIPFAI